MSKHPTWQHATFIGFISLSAHSINTVQAASFSLGEIEGQFDSSLSVGTSWAARGANPSNIGASHGGNASSETGDDGRLNFKKGETFSKIFKGTHDLELKYEDSGIFVRGKYWYDFELKDEHRHFYDIDDHNRKEAARSSGAQLLDAFIYQNYTVADQPGSVRLGKQVVSWGESSFIQNSINSINPIDVAAFRRPGAEIKEGLIPVNMIYLSQNLTENVSAEAFYQLEWEQTVVDNCGTFFGADTVADGCDDRLETQLPVGPALTTYLPRGSDRDARNSGQFGVAVRWYAKELNDTEFGLYAINYHSRTPYLSAVVANAASLISGVGRPGVEGNTRLVSSGGYFFEYPEDIHLYGLSFSTTLGATAVSGEVSYRPNMPMQVNAVDITTPAFLGAAALPLNTPVFSSGLAAPIAGEEFQGYVRKPFSQAQVTVAHFFDQVMAADRLTLVTEVGYNHIGDLNDNALRFGRDAAYGNGQMPAGVNPLDGSPLPANTSCTALLNTANPSDCNKNGFYTNNSWGYRARAILDYQNVFASVNLKPSLSWSHDVHGYGPNFNEGSKAISLGVNADYRNAYTASISYTDFFGGEYNTATDRDFVALSFGVNF